MTTDDVENGQMVCWSPGRVRSNGGVKATRRYFRRPDLANGASDPYSRSPLCEREISGRESHRVTYYRGKQVKT